jgi:hypothetical protein
MKDTVKKFYETGIATNKDPDVANQLLVNLTRKPKKEKTANMAHFPTMPENYEHQMDLLILPHDGDYKYAVTIVDVGTDKCEAEPIAQKTADAVKQAIETIYGRSILKMPEVMVTDAGSEFKGTVKKYLEDNNVHVRTAETGRHRTVGMVENRNKFIGKALFNIMMAKEALTKKSNSEWVDDLPDVIEELNKRALLKPKRKQSDKVQCSGDACNMLQIGQKVRRALNEPNDFATGEKQHGRFRETDIRWLDKPQTITNFVLQGGQPPLYELDNMPSPMFTKDQLQVIPDKEELPPASVLEKKIPQKDTKDKSMVDEIVETVLNKDKLETKPEVRNAERYGLRTNRKLKKLD